MRRVVVTGVGPITSIGMGRVPFWRACLAGTVVAEPIPEEWTSFTSYRSRIWAPLKGFVATDYHIESRELKVLDPAACLTLASTWLALKDAGLAVTCIDDRAARFTIDGLDPERGAVVMGTGIGGLDTLTEMFGVHVRDMLANQLADTIAYAEAEPVIEALTHRFNPFVVSMLMPNAPGGRVGIKYGLKGENTTIATACASGTMAVGGGYRLIASGEADLAVTGGVEFISGGRGFAFRGFDIASALTQRNDAPLKASRPFDRDRDGFLYSEGGSGVLILEEYERARARGAPILAEISGYHTTMDAFSIMQPDPDGAQIKRMIRELLVRVGLNPGQVDYFNAHGTSTKFNDKVEAGVLMEIFGPGEQGPWVNSTKSLIGHTIGASGAIEAIATVLSIEEGVLHPSVNLDHPEYDLKFAREAVETPVNTALSASYGFAGHNACLAFRKV